MKKLIILVIVAFLAYGYIQENNISIPGSSFSVQNTVDTLKDAFTNRESNLQIQGTGIVTKILADDNKGSRHQRFILRTASGQQLLIAHNIDLAPKIISLKTGDSVEFYGEYEWNPKGGVIHWTHHDPGKRHIDGWLKHNGKKYQ